MALVFPNDDTLRMALTSGLVPSSLSLSPVRCARHSDGTTALTTGNAVPDGVAAALGAVGVAVRDDAAVGIELAHWLEALPLYRLATLPALTDQSPILFEIPSVDIAGLASEMLRLGNDRQSFRLLRTGENATVLLRALGPPYFSLLRAIDRTGADLPCAYVEHGSGVWIEYGWTHPLAGELRSPEGQIVLLRPPDRWRYIDAAAFHDIYDALTLDQPPEAVAWSEAPADALDVPLKLAAGNTIDAAELWVLGERGEEQIDALVHTAHARTLGGLTFAVGKSEGRRIAVLRARPSKHGPPELAVDGALVCRPFQRVPNLFVPCGAGLSPPLSREIVRRLLADDPSDVTWLAPLADGEFVPRSLPDDAFRPLSDWVEHVLTANRAALVDWVAASRCDFGNLVSAEAFVPIRAERAPPSPAASAATESAAPAATPSPPSPRRPRPARRAPAAPPATPSRGTPSQLQLQLRRTEDRFLAIDGPLEVPDRQKLWPELGRLNSALDHAAEAALCWLHALWETGDALPQIAWAWTQSERALPARSLGEADLARLMPANPTTGADLRPLAAALVWATSQTSLPAALAARLGAVQNYLQQHDRLLPVRAVWLTWHGLTRRAGGDTLALARVRDRLLDRLLTDGLSAERDLPVFLRFSGQRGGDRLRTVRDRLEHLRRAIHRWSGFRPGDGLQQTPAYIDLMFAFASARLGEAASARTLLGDAAAALDASGNDAHRFLLEAFRWRIEQVLAGKPHAGPLPPEQLEYLEQMRRDYAERKGGDHVAAMPPYVIDRMRREYRILDPHEELDPYRHNNYARGDLVGELDRLAEVRDPRTLRDSIRRIVGASKSVPPNEVHLRILAGSLQLGARIGSAFCSELLDQVEPAMSGIPPSDDPIVQERQALLLERALLFAVHFDRTDLVPTFVARLEGLLARPAVSIVLEARSRLIKESLRSLRKCGLRDQTDRLLQLLADAAHYDPAETRAVTLHHTDLETTRILLHIATGWLSADQADRARPILDSARATILSGQQLQPNDLGLYVSLVCTYIGALARAPLAEALDRVEELFTSGRMQRLSNAFTTSHYYSRFHLSIVEAVVLALANEEFAMGPTARRWLDDDEYLVRRRIHRDVRLAVDAV